MLAAYYGKGCDSSELFTPYQIAEDEDSMKYLNRYNVILLSIQDFLNIAEYSVDTMIPYLQEEVIEELKEEFPGNIPETVKNLSVARNKLYSRTKEGKHACIIEKWEM